jgi:hypothetical protein
VSQAASGSATYYHWDGLNVMLERDGEEQTTRTLTHGPTPVAGIGTPVSTREPGEPPTDLWFGQGALGSTRLLTDGGSPPTVAARYAFGRPGRCGEPDPRSRRHRRDLSLRRADG